ncbi:MAG: hypothetical protein ACRD5J_12375 [Nitrososphaeraceae archaeon]
MQYTINVISAIVASAVLTTFMTPFGTNYLAAQENLIVRDSETVLLEGMTIPAGGFIHLYDSTPYMITNGHIAANIPCDENSTSPFVVLTGQAPNVTAADLEVVNELSTPGTMCIYHVDIPPQNATVTDVAIQNPTESDEELPAGSTVLIGVNEIMPIG